MRRIHANVRPKAQAIDIERVGPLGGMILISIGENQPIAIQKLATMLARDKAQMTRHIQMLERRNLVTRTPSPDDGRVTLINLTERGHELVLGFQTAMAEVIEDLLQGVDKAEIEQFSAVLSKALLSGSARPND